MSIEFPDELVITECKTVNGSKTFKLKESFRYISSYGVITVPRGFITDGASVPRIFWSIFSPYGDYFDAAIIHDYLYTKRNKVYSRKQSDLIFKEAMYNSGISWITREIIFRGVILFGGKSFKRK